MPAEEDADGQPSFWDLLEELGVVVTIPTFLIIVLQVSGSACHALIYNNRYCNLKERLQGHGLGRCCTACDTRLTPEAVLCRA